MEYIATVCIFIYNHEKYIERTIKSVLNQKTKYAYKIIAIDDHSTDQTREVIDKVADNNPLNNIVKIYQEHNQGLNNNVEYIFEKLDTKYVFLLGGDDYWIDDNKIEKQLNLLENNPNISYVHTGLNRFDENTNIIKNGLRSWNWDMPQRREKRVVDVFVDSWTSYPCASTCCLRTDIIKKGLERYGKLLHSYVVGEGTFINVSLCMFGDEYAFIPDPTTVYTVRRESLSHHKLPIDYFNYRANYFKEKIETLQLINLKTEREFYFFVYGLNELLVYAHENSLRLEFDKLLVNQKTEIPFIIRQYFYLCNHSFFAYRVNRKIQPHIRKMWSKMTRNS